MSFPLLPIDVSTPSECRHRGIIPSEFVMMFNFKLRLINCRDVITLEGGGAKAIETHKSDNKLSQEQNVDPL
jgi:hypothetical protein